MLLGIFGRRESGKTVLARAISYRLAALRKLTFVFDPAGQWPEHLYKTADELRRAERLEFLNVIPSEEPETVIKLAQEATNSVYIHDEVDLLCTATHWKSETGKELARRGRHPWYGRVAMIYTGQRFVNCHADLISLASKLCVFETTGSLDVERVRRELGDDYVSAIATLAPYEFVIWPDRLICKVGIDGPSTQRKF